MMRQVRVHFMYSFLAQLLSLLQFI